MWCNCLYDSAIKNKTIQNKQSFNNYTTVKQIFEKYHLKTTTTDGLQDFGLANK